MTEPTTKTGPTPTPAKPDVPPFERGAQYPGDNLATALGMLEKIRAAVGFNAANREILAKALGYQTMSGHAARKLGVLSHFDLIERAGKGAARISALGKSILIPTTPEEKRDAVADAAKRPNLYGALIQKYKENAIPTLLPNLLVREHGIHTSASDVAARTFRETMEFAGLLRNGVLYEYPLKDTDIEANGVDEGDRESVSLEPIAGLADSVARARPSASEKSPAVVRAPSYTIPLDSAGRVASINIPLPVTTRDLTKISAWLKYMSSLVDEETGTSDATES